MPSILTRDGLSHYHDVYGNGLLEDTLPFWINHCVDREHGGFLFGMGRQGDIINSDKPIWIQARFAWLLATLYNTVEPREEWLELAKHGIDFVRKHGFDKDGRMFFLVDRQGHPLRKRRYLFSEAFMTIALAAYAKAANDTQAAEEALELFKLIIRYYTTPGLSESKYNTVTRPMKGLAMPMILIVTAQILRETIADPICDEWIDRSIAEIKNDFMHPEFKAVLETVGPKGEFIDTFEGRMLTPGHAIEAAWFILHEAKIWGDEAMLETGLTILDWCWEWGWDKKHGGIIYYRDAKDLPCTEYWHDMKFWWPQNETIIATMLAWSLTGEEKYAKWHQMAHEWAYQKFPDPEFGEWYGYLHRNGSVSSELKGNCWKGPFHLPRMQWYCSQLAEEMLNK